MSDEGEDSPRRLCAVVHGVDHLSSARHPQHPSRGPLVHLLLRALRLVGCDRSVARTLMPSPCLESDLAEYHSADYVSAIAEVEEEEEEDDEDVDSLDPMPAKKRRRGAETGKGGIDIFLVDIAALLALPAPSPQAPSENMRQYGLADDCPPFKGMMKYCRAVAGGTLTAAEALCAGHCLRACHFEGGRHHARRDCAAGFCYVADVVLGVMRLTRKFRRVLVIDIDAHHGDGVEEAFYHSEKVTCLSLHMYGKGIFPGTGTETATGSAVGRHRTVNLPLRSGCRDDAYRRLFRTVAEAVRREVNPVSIVLLVGADALHTDPLGELHLSEECLLKCVAQVRDWGLPTLVLGSGGYDERTAPRYWAHVTALMADDGTRWPQRDHSGTDLVGSEPEDYPPGLVAGLLDTSEIPPEVGDEAFERLCGGAGAERYCGLEVPKPPPAGGRDPNGVEYIDYLIHYSVNNIAGGSTCFAKTPRRC